jgi:hypothetical protein
MLVFTPTSAFFSFWILLFIFIFVGSYGLNFLGLAIIPAIVLTFVILGLIVTGWWLARQQSRIAFDVYELLGLIIVFVSALVYFISPSLPSLIPPSYSGDPALHYAFTDSVYSTGKIIGDDPGGPSLMAATFAQWLGLPILRTMHPTTSLWLALIACAIYGMACVSLPQRPVSKLIALLAPFYLFISTDYFGAMILGSQYFYSQSAGHLFVVASVFFFQHYIETRHAFWQGMWIASFFGVSVTYQLWLIVPGTMFLWALWWSWRADRSAFWSVIRIGFIIGAILAGFSAATRVTNNGFIPALSRLTLDGGSVIPPSFYAFGGWLLLFAIPGIPFAWRNQRTQFVIFFLTSCAALSLFIFSSHLIFGGGMYWFYKSLFLWILPLALLCVISINWLVNHLSVQLAFSKAFLILGMLGLSGSFIFIVNSMFPPPSYTPITETDAQAALWAKQNLNTLHVNYIGRKGLVPQWIGVALWGEKYPPDLFLDLARLGPRTFEEWRDTPGWGEYLLISSDQHHPLTPDIRVIYQQGASMIVQKPVAPPPITEPPQFKGATLSLADYEITQPTVNPGQRISVTTQIQTHKLPSRHVIWRLQLRDAQGESAGEASIEPFDAQFPMERWPDNIVLPQTLGVQVPVYARAGIYDLLLGLYYLGNGEPLLFQNTDGESVDVIHLGKIKINLPPITPHELGSLTRINSTVGDQIRLLGYRLVTLSPLRPGHSFQVMLYWQSQMDHLPDYTVFVQLLDSQGKLIAQRDMTPRKGAFPTSFWTKDEIVPDPHLLTIPQDTPPGNYYLIVGMYSFPSLRRLNVVNALGTPSGDHIGLPTVVEIQ